MKRKNINTIKPLINFNTKSQVLIPIIIGCILLNSIYIYTNQITNIYQIILSFIISLGISYLLKLLYDFIHKRIVLFKMNNSLWLRKTWKKLEHAEKSVLITMFNTNNHSQQLDCNDQTVLTLKQKMCISVIDYQPDNQNTLIYILQPWTEKMIKENYNN